MALRPIDPPTREVFDNIAPWMQVVFYVMMIAAVGVLAFRVFRLVRLYGMGEPGGWVNDPRQWAVRLWTHAIRHKRIGRRTMAGALHVLLFSGFVVLSIGTTVLFIADAGPINFHVGWYYLLYELTMEVFGVVLIVGCGLALYRRIVRRPPHLGHAVHDWFVLSLLIVLSVTGFILEALRLEYSGVDAAYAQWSVIGHVVQILALRSVDIDTSRAMHLGLWWFHAVLVATFFVSLPITRMLHVITTPLHIAIRPEQHLGVLQPISIEQVEETGLVGVSDIAQLNTQQRLGLDACMSCGRCDDVCPALASNKPLSPQSLILDLRRLMRNSGADDTARPELHGQTIAPDTLWACTMCQACVYECPALIGHVDLIANMRRYLVGEGRITGSEATALRQLSAHGNPFGAPASDRFGWADGLDVPTVETNPDFEYLLWIGCAASLDPRAQRIARATVQLLNAADVNYAVLGNAESCTGDPARRLGDEFLFQDMAQRNIATLDHHRVRRIITPCPHCFNTLNNEYPQFDGHYEVQHHSQFLAGLIEAGRLTAPDHEDSITLHDPCYLARANSETHAPRTAIGADHNAFRELARHGDRTSCCGAGGGRMWFEEPADQRVSVNRAAEVVESGAKTLATACPFCANMMADGLAGVDGGGRVTVVDVAEVLVNGRATK